MANLDSLLTVFDKKGWSLYADAADVTFETVISAGKAVTIEDNRFYYIFPSAARHDQPDEVNLHIVNAKETGQTPVYDDEVNPPLLLTGVHIAGDEINLVSTTEDASCVFSALPELESAINHYVSNYNIFHFNNIVEVEDFIKLQEIGPAKPLILPGEQEWIYVKNDATLHEALIHADNPPRFLFRGQNERHEPCFPSIARGLKKTAQAMTHLNETEQSQLILDLVKTQWFVEILRDTAPLQWMKANGLGINETAVAQHYGISTGYMDLTQSFEVATFFACTRFDENKNEWVTMNEGEGVIYLVDRPKAAKEGRTMAISFQPFPRPSGQWAWTHEMILGEDFDKLPYVIKLVFKHDAVASERVMEKFGDGKSLFPDDPLATIAEKIKRSKIVPKQIAIEVINDLIDDAHGLSSFTVDDMISILQQTSDTVVSDEPVTIIDDDISAEIEANWMLRADGFTQRVKVKSVVPALKKEKDNNIRIAQCKKLLETEPENTDALCSLARLLTLKGDLNGALSTAEKFFDLESAYTKMHLVIELLDALLIIEQYHFLLWQFQKEGSLLNTYARPYYFVVAWFLIDELPDEYQKINPEIKETVDEIISRVVNAQQKE